MEKNWQKNITFIWQKVDFYFEMVQFGPMVLEKKGLIANVLSLPILTT